MQEVGGGLYISLKRPHEHIPPALLHDIGTSLMGQLMTHRRRGKSEAFHNNWNHASDSSALM